MELETLANQLSRSMVAIIDTVTQRGGFRGEELSTIGTVRDQCMQLGKMAEEKLGAAEEGGSQED
jgi:hypothetical protein